MGDAAEEIILARPRLVLSGNLSSSGTNAALAKAGVKVAAFGVPATIDESLAQVRAVAQDIGRVEAGERLVGRMEAALTPSPLQGRGPGRGAVEPASKPHPSPLPTLSPEGERVIPTALIWQAGGFVAGAGTVQDEMLARAGYRNASDTYGLKQWDVLPLETLIQSPPDVIFMPVKARGEEGRTLAMRKTLAARLKGRTRIIPFPDRLLFCAGPTMVEAMAVMRRARLSISSFGLLGRIKAKHSPTVPPERSRGTISSLARTTSLPLGIVPRLRSGGTETTRLAKSS